MKRNTLLVSLLGVAGLVAVWWFTIRKASAADATASTSTDSLSNALNSGSAQTLGSTSTSTGGTDLVSTFGALLTSLIGTPSTTNTTSGASNLADSGKALDAYSAAFTSKIPAKVVTVPTPTNRASNRKAVDLAKVPTSVVTHPVERSTTTKATATKPAIKKL